MPAALTNTVQTPCHQHTAGKISAPTLWMRMHAAMHMHYEYYPGCSPLHDVDHTHASTLPQVKRSRISECSWFSIIILTGRNQRPSLATLLTAVQFFEHCSQ